MIETTQPHDFDVGECRSCGCAECYDGPCPGNLVDRPERCVVDGCTSPVTCFGSYDGAPVDYGCDEHCGHGNEDGWCGPLEDQQPTPPASRPCSRCGKLHSRRSPKRWHSYCLACHAWCMRRNRAKHRDPQGLDPDQRPVIQRKNPG